MSLRKSFKTGDPCYYVEFFSDKVTVGKVIACKFDFKRFMWKYIVDIGTGWHREVYDFEYGFKAHKTMDSAKSRAADETYCHIRYLINQAREASESYNNCCSELDKIIKDISVDSETAKGIYEYIDYSFDSPVYPDYTKIANKINETIFGKENI